MGKWAELDEMPTLNGRIVMILIVVLAMGFNMTNPFSGDNNISLHLGFDIPLP